MHAIPIIPCICATLCMCGGGGMCGCVCKSVALISVGERERVESKPTPHHTPCIHIHVQMIQQNLRENDRTIYQEFERIRSTIDKIQILRLQEEKKCKEERLFDEYFGSLFTKEKEMNHKIAERHPSLHVPEFDTERSYSQTLV